MKLTKEHKEALRDFHFNYHKQIPTYTQDELVQYIVDNFDEILSNQEKASYVDYLTQDKTLSKNLVHFINWATDSEVFDKLFMDSEFKKNWYPMLRRMEKILEGENA